MFPFRSLRTFEPCALANLVILNISRRSAIMCSAIKIETKVGGVLDLKCAKQSMLHNVLQVCANQPITRMGITSIKKVITITHFIFSGWNHSKRQTSPEVVAPALTRILMIYSLQLGRLDGEKIMQILRKLLRVQYSRNSKYEESSVHDWPYLAMPITPQAERAPAFPIKKIWLEKLFNQIANLIKMETWWVWWDDVESWWCDVRGSHNGATKSEDAQVATRKFSEE